MSSLIAVSRNVSLFCRSIDSSSSSSLPEVSPLIWLPLSLFFCFLATSKLLVVPLLSSSCATCWLLPLHSKHLSSDDILSRAWTILLRSYASNGLDTLETRQFQQFNYLTSMVCWREWSGQKFSPEWTWTCIQVQLSGRKTLNNDRKKTTRHNEETTRKPTKGSIPLQAAQLRMCIRIFHSCLYENIKH